MISTYYCEPITHHGIQGMKWGVRRYQNPDGSLTEEGKKRYYNDDGSLTRKGLNSAKQLDKYGLLNEKQREQALNDKPNDVKRRIERGTGIAGNIAGGIAAVSGLAGTLALTVSAAKTSGAAAAGATFVGGLLGTALGAATVKGGWTLTGKAAGSITRAAMTPSREENEL